MAGHYKTQIVRNKQRGFTIVELLIVIVVIAILAAIVIVAYKGVQERAESSSVVETARAYVTGLQSWAGATGAYPVPGGTDIGTCLGSPSLFSGNVCPNAPAWGLNTNYDPGFNQTLITYMGKQYLPLGYWSGGPQGVFWYHSNYYGNGHAVLYYAVGPNTNCGLPNVQQPNGTPPAGNAYTFRDSNSTTCIIQLN